MSEPSKPDEKDIELPFTSDDDAEQRLWRELGSLPRETPSPALKREFYRQLDRQRNRPTLLQMLSRVLGLQGNPGFATAAACLALGLAAGVLVSKTGSVDRTEFSALQHQVASLNRDLVLDRLQDDSANTRMLGVVSAADLSMDDPQIVSALITRALEDPVYSVRSAAIDALGPQLSTPAVGDNLMMLFNTTDSPIVQLALVDLVLRYGSSEQIKYLLQISEQGILQADLVEYVHSSIRSGHDNETI